MRRYPLTTCCPLTVPGKQNLSISLFCSFLPPSSSITLVLFHSFPSQEPTLPSFFLDPLGESSGSELLFLWGGMHNFQTFHKTVMVALCISPGCYYAESHLFLFLNPILRASFCYLSLGICQGQEGGWAGEVVNSVFPRFIWGSLTVKQVHWW